MPTELNRIKELAGLQQEAPAVGLTAQQKQGLDAINAKYGKYIGYGNGGSLPVEAMERAIDPGSTLWADDKEENELKAYMKKMGYKDLSDMESKDEEYVDNVQLPISDAMADDLQKVLGDYNDNSGLAQAAKDYLGSLGETAVAEAPATASLTPNQIEAFKKWYATYSKMQSKDVYNYAQGIFKAYMETGVTELDGASKQDPRGKAYDDLAKIFPDMDGDIEAIGEKLRSQGVDPLDMEAQEESVLQPEPVLNAVKETPAISQVDEAIKKATAQLKSFSNFDGLKPYKPKKK